MPNPSLSSEYLQFRQTFFSESEELLADMSIRLERLADEGLDREGLDAVFRAVHSIKAGAGMFDYSALVAFAHAFETLLDRLRDGRIRLDSTVAGLVLRAGDVLAELVSAAQAGRAVPEDFFDEVARALGAAVQSDAPPAVMMSPTDDIPTAARQIWRIVFQPHSELLQHANEPLLLIRELGTLGQLKVTCDATRVPVLEQLDVSAAYLSWTFELETDRSRATIAEVFEFVEDDAVISIEALESVIASENDGDLGFGLFSEPAAPSPSTAAALPEAAAPVPMNPTIRVDLSRVDRLVNMVGELIIAQAMHRQKISHIAVDTGLDALESLTRELQDCVMSVRMQPVRTVFQRIPRLVRDVASKIGKSVHLQMSGEQTELDKTVIEELADPLTHMIRNSLDHGIEVPEVRLAAGKVAEGTIRLSAAHVGSNIVIQIEDDGAGINRERLYAKAVEKGIIAEGTRLNDEEIVDLIFAPGFSTASQVSDLSGRGVGMDVVRRNIQKMGGRIQVSSMEGQGTRFTLVIPLTLAVLDGMLVAVGDERYIMPLTSIVESFRPDPDQVREMAGGAKVAAVRGEYFPLISLSDCFDVRGATSDVERGLVVLVETASGARLGLQVDDLLGQQQIVIKSLQENFTPVRGVSGATILGDGNVALILDIEQIAALRGRDAPTTTPRALSGALSE